MGTAIGLDIGGTKIAGAIYDAAGLALEQITIPTPATYDLFLDACRTMVMQLEQKAGQGASIGVGVPYAVANVPFLYGRDAQKDLQNILKRKITFANDANCAALAEAKEGAAKGYRSVFGLILGTGVGGGLIFNGQIVAGANNLCGEIGHMPFPYYEEEDGERTICGCGQLGCIERLVAGPALGRLYQKMTGREPNTRHIVTQVRQGDGDAARVLDRYYTVLAKAMVAVIHSFDPDIITVSGGLNTLPGIYSEVPKRWGQYALDKNPVTKFVPASFGPMAGLRGAALVGQNA